MMKIIAFILIIILILILILPNKKSNSDTKNPVNKGCGCSSKVESYENTNPTNPTEPADPIQYIIVDPTQLDLFSIKYTGKNYGWEFSALPHNVSSTAQFKPKSSLDTVDHIYGRIALKKYDSKNNILYDEKGNSVLEDPNNNIVTKIMGDIQNYIKNNKVAQSNVKLYDTQNKTYVFVDTNNKDIAQLMSVLDNFKKEVYKNYIQQ
jgi:hypothetical protein